MHDHICKITSPLFGFLVHSPASGNNISYPKQHKNDKDVQM